MFYKIIILQIYFNICYTGFLHDLYNLHSNNNLTPSYRPREKYDINKIKLDIIYNIINNQFTYNQDHNYDPAIITKYQILYNKGYNNPKFLTELIIIYIQY